MYPALLLIILSNAFLIKAVPLNELFSWNVVQFKWSNEDLKNKALKSGAYIPKNNVPLGVARWKNKVFLTINRWKPGVASTLNYVDIGEDKSPRLKPYPSWESNLVLNTSCVSSNSVDSPIVSVFRVWVDPCDRLWVLDDGVDDLFGRKIKLVDKSILIFNLKNNELIRRYYFKKSNIKEDSVFGNIVVDTTSDSCDDAFAYISDFAGIGMVVYDFRKNISGRVKHLYFYPEPLSGSFYVGDVEAHWIDGVLGVALGKRDNYGNRSVYFNSLTGTSQFKVSSRVLQDFRWASTHEAFDEFKFLGDRGKNSQSTSCGLDEKTGVIFYTQPNKDGILCWNPLHPLIPSNTTLVAQDKMLLEFPADIKIDQDRNILVISNRLPQISVQVTQ